MVRFCCTTNMGNIIKSHSKKLINLAITIHSHATIETKTAEFKNG